MTSDGRNGHKRGPNDRPLSAAPPDPPAVTVVLHQAHAAPARLPFVNAAHLAPVQGNCRLEYKAGPGGPRHPLELPSFRALCRTTRPIHGALQPIVPVRP